jgi:xylulose-5-phosphate/fructose-6-phosphate phosphoketolase
MMLRMNKAGRFDVAERAIALLQLAQPNSVIGMKGHELRSWYQHQNQTYEKYALDYGIDSPDLEAGATMFEA